MRLQVNGAKLFFDVEGIGWEPDGGNLRQKPTLILLHGGPGLDHSVFKPAWSVLRDTAQIIYLDHRGNGRSEDGRRNLWTLDQWAADIASFCETLEIERPILCGVSFGGIVAQSVALKYPDLLGGLILVSTTGKFEFDVMLDAFERVGGQKAKSAAREYWLNPTSESRAAYGRICFPLYFQTELDPQILDRIVEREACALHFNGIEKGLGEFDFLLKLSTLATQTLILAGEDDPITPVAFSEKIMASIPEDLVSLNVYDKCGHGVIEDRPDALDEVRNFIVGCANGIRS